MNTYLTSLAIIFATLSAHAQEAPLPPSLAIAAREGMQKLEDQKQQDIIYYSKNNTPQQDNAEAKELPDDFYELYIRDADNRYYNTYNANSIDPVLTGMPAPGPNLNYQYVDPSSSGNYDKVVRQ